MVWSVDLGDCVFEEGEVVGCGVFWEGWVGGVGWEGWWGDVGVGRGELDEEGGGWGGGRV